MENVSLVTGGAQRIGRSIVERLARERHAVAIHCRHSTAAAEELASRIRAAVVRAELAYAASVAGLVDQARIKAIGQAL